jgi:hypothetical protein
VEGAGLPALDVVAFVGFAERGPLDLPVAVDDINMYRAIFGADLAVARGEDGRIVHANLPRAVAAFFANGGRRCYVVRVAGKQAKPARCQVPGLVAISRQDQSPRRATLYAASPGRWGNRLRLATRLLIAPLPADKFALRAPPRLDWQTGSAPQAIQVGDLLRLTFDGGLQWLFPVTAIGRSPSLEETGQALLEAAAVWQPITASSNTSPALQVERIDRLNLDGLPLESPSSRLRRVERLRFELRLRVGDEYRLTLTELTFNAGHPRFWGEVVLPESSALQRQSLTGGTLPEEQRTLSSAPQTRTITGAARAARLFRALQAGRRLDPARDGSLDPATLAGLLAPLDTGEDGNATMTFLPLGMLAADGEFGGPARDDQGDDDLARFASGAAGLFMDDYLVPNPENPATFTAPAALLTTAADRYYLQNHRLKGLHSLLFVDEVALLSVPDAVHRNWRPGSARQLSSERPPPVAAPPSGDFADCRQPPRVVAVNPATGSLDGHFEVTVTGSGFIPDPATTVQFADTPARSVQVSSATTLRCQVPPAGQAGPVTVAVSNTHGTGIAVAAFSYQPESTEPSLPELAPVTAFDLAGSPLLLIQRAVLDFCQARTDVVGILSLPAHFEKRQCIEWQETWRRQLRLPRRGKVFTAVREIADPDLSYVAVYHPWLLMADSGSSEKLQTIPPDGAVGGMIAARERTRQVWVAPANMPLTGVLDLTPRFSEDDWAELFALQFNLIRQQPRGFHTPSAYTLSDERDLLQLSVRRLLILLRKVVVELGMDSVFESNREPFRSAIRLALENLLRRLFEQGAFAGDTQPAAFRVSVDASLNPPQSIEQGQLLVQVQIAPSQPLEFIEVLLLRAGEGLQAVEA